MCVFRVEVSIEFYSHWLQENYFYAIEEGESGTGLCVLLLPEKRVKGSKNETREINAYQ